MVNISKHAIHDHPVGSVVGHRLSYGRGTKSIFLCFCTHGRCYANDEDVIDDDVDYDDDNDQ